jgi:hypothetical protein
VGFLFWGSEFLEINFASQVGGKEKAASESSFGRQIGKLKSAGMKTSRPKIRDEKDIYECNVRH